MSTDLIDHIRATPDDRAMVRAAVRGALLRHAVACRDDAEHATSEEEAAELITEAHAAIVRAVAWEA
jgi:hypothetical protein